MENGREEAEKAYRFAEERFVAGDLAVRPGTPKGSSLRYPPSRTPPPRTRSTPRWPPPHAEEGTGTWCSACRRTPCTRTSRSSTSVSASSSTKNRSAAADGAFKLLQQAWEALSARHPPGPASASKPSRAQPRRTYAPPPRAPPSWAKTGRCGSRPPPPDWSSFGFTPPPEPDGSTFDFKAWRAAYARANGTIYCGHCDSESAAEGASHGKSGERCHSCGARFSPPRRSRATPDTGA
ncbi:hypothetical protein GQ55_9G018000 [Panicum hallii var. hallii]|uniref:Uncharacterized protein n=1 Tax=Panicum hallii var. hallii TaxID=1504633 RepID=A0A2T7BYK5_9POAL|nr:hypothetical protein GQ55_9G018000 [Panicum hallii var. hallii]